MVVTFPQVKPTHVLNAAGLTGRPNVDWCEDHKAGTRDLEFGELVVAGQVHC